jgi:putative zinc finger/helix-turn-helix YgiT family protein
MKCPTCNKTDTFRPWEGSVKLAGLEVVGRGQRCRSCGEILFDGAEVERQEREIATALVARGVRTGPEFKLVRKVAGLRATEVADMFGVRPETVSRWERGEVEVPRTAAYALGELYEHPKITRQKLEAFAQ